MSNEQLLGLSLLTVYSLVLVWFALFKKHGLFGWLILATIIANIEVVVEIDAFGFKQTLGNVLFASTFLVTDIISEIYGESEANKAVNMSIWACISFILLSQFWMFFEPGTDDFMLRHMQQLFSMTPRVLISGLAVFAVVQKLDVWLYHKFWAITGEESHRFLWMRNNGATIISQIVNAVLFNLCAFYGIFPDNALAEIIVVSFCISLITSILDTPYVYLATLFHEYDND